MTTIVRRHHDISTGHRVSGHESKCAHLHGHNYRVHFAVKALSGELDQVGRVVDFGVLKSGLCEWLERNWDHKMLIWNKDPAANAIESLDDDLLRFGHQKHHGVVLVPFNPTAENMAKHLLLYVGPDVLSKDLQLVEVTIEETYKCSVTEKV